MLISAIIYYYFNLKVAIIFTIFNLFVAGYLYNHIKKTYYTPKKDKETGKDVHEIYSSFCRTDKCPSFLRIFFGLITMFYIKFTMICLSVLLAYFVSKIALYLANKEIDYYKQKISFYAMKGCALAGYLIARSAGVINSELIRNREEVIKIYKEYLGDDFNYDKEIDSNEYATAISNHIGWVDIFFLGGYIKGTFAAKISIKKIPCIGLVCQGMSCVMIDRTNRDSNKDAFVEINKRQDLIMKKECYNKMILFPEGTGSNNTSLIQFKKGAFFQLNPVKPFVILLYGNGNTHPQNGPTKRVHNDKFSLAAGGMNMFIHLILTCCHLYYEDWKVLDLPVITPNEYMFNKYKDLGKDNSDIYMEVCRRMMSRLSGLPLNDEMCFKKKLEYLSILKGKQIKNT